MKFLLVMQICSAVIQECSKPIDMYPLHTNFFNCSTAGYINALGIVRELGIDDVNQAKIMIQFRCKEIVSS